jgi:hypothetical protein
MPKLLGVVGALVICAGLDLLWQARRELRFWFSTYLKVLRAMLRLKEPLRFLPMKEIAQKRQSAAQFLLGMGFAFVLGPILIVLGVTLMFYMRL